MCRSSRWICWTSRRVKAHRDLELAWRSLRKVLMAKGREGWMISRRICSPHRRESDKSCKSELVFTSLWPYYRLSRACMSQCETSSSRDKLRSGV